MDRILIYLIIGLGIGLYLFFKGFTWLKEKRLIENIPTSKVRSIAMGLVEIFGKIQPTNKGIVLSPFSNSKCVYYSYTIEEYQNRSNNHSGNWITINDGRYAHPFYLKDGTGQVLIDPGEAEISIPKNYEYKSGLGRGVPKKIETFLAGTTVSSKSLFGFNRSLRYREYIIKPNEKMYIIGTAGDNPHFEDGNATKNEQDIMIQKGNTGQFFYISNKNEADVINRFKWKVIGGLFGGSAISIACLLIILAYLGIF